MTSYTQTRRRFTVKQKAEAVELGLQEGLSCNTVAERLGLPTSSLARWVRQVVIGPSQGRALEQWLLTDGESSELNRLRKKNREARRDCPVSIRLTGALHRCSGYPPNVVASLPGAGRRLCRAGLQPGSGRVERPALVRRADVPLWRRLASATGA